MRRVVVGLAVAAMALGAPVSAATVRVEGTVRWDVRWSIRWNDGSDTRWFDLDSGKVDDFGETAFTFTCDGGPASCGWYGYGSFWRRPSKPTKAACREGWETDDLGQRYRALIDPERGSPGITWAAPDGTWLCARTERRFARIRILHWPTKDELWFRFRFTTWERS